MSTATLAALHEGDRTSQRPAVPLVFLNGRFCASAQVRSLVMSGPLDTRTARIEVQDDRWRALVGSSQTVRILMPEQLSTGENHLVPLLEGRIDTSSSDMSDARHHHHIAAHCDWSHDLERPFEIGTAGRTFGEILEEIDQAFASGIERTLLSRELLGQVVASRVIAGTLGQVLSELATEHGLYVQREMQWSAGRYHEKRMWRQTEHGRPLVLRRTDLANPAGVLKAIAERYRSKRPTRHIARVAGQVVESTFHLAAGWESVSEGKADSEYVRSTSTGFDSVRNTYRLWLLNEDGLIDSETFDLASLFGEDREIPASPLRFLPPLTHDEHGRRLDVVVQVSLDSGNTWFGYAGQHIVLEDRAGVYLSDDALPSAFFDAAKVGNAQIRVTASLQSPLPFEQTRWVGNPFAGSFDTQPHGLGNRYAWRRVLPSSIYHDAVRNHQMAADECDDRVAMHDWLVRRSLEFVELSGTIKVTCAQLMPGMRVGDRLMRLADREYKHNPLRFQRVEHDLMRDVTSITLAG